MPSSGVKEWREGAMVTALNTGVARLLGRGQIFFGAAAAVFQVVLIAINSDQGVPFLAAGIWSGFFFLLAGFAALAAAAKPTRCYVITLMVLSIISAIAAVFGLFLCSVLDIHVTRRNCEFFDYFSEVYYDENEAGPTTTPVLGSPYADLSGGGVGAAEVAVDDDGTFWGVVNGGNRRVYGLDGEIEIPPRRDSHWFACSRPSYVLALILDSLLLVFAVVSVIASIWCSILCCRAVCFPDPHPRFLYFSPTSTTTGGESGADASLTSGCAASVPVAVVTHPAAAVVCLPIANGTVAAAAAANGIVTSSSQYLTNGSLYPTSTEFIVATTEENRSGSIMAPVLTTSSALTQPHSAPADGSGEPVWDIPQLPPYQATDTNPPLDVALPPYNPNYMETRG